ncbi:MAG: Verru_Chthon cassette protein A [Terrimicrobiaceae bacterium]
MKSFLPAIFKTRRAAALIIVLSCLVLLSALTLGFFLSTAGEARNTSAFAEGNRARTLADTALNIVIGQLRDATCQDRTDISWASQPGLIKTFGTSGTLASAFKLYSSSNPRVTASSFDPSTDQAPAPPLPSASQAVQNAWSAQYADINSPVIRNSGGSSTRYYPILNPAALGGGIEGFKVESAWQVDTNGDGSVDIPMPVEWMYVFRDGSVGPASGGTDTNPIIGRVAFWTDDDTCKVNINTASEGSFWDIPRSVAFNEARMAWLLPVKGEFQTVAGHPATTSLSPVIGALVGKPATQLIPFGTTATEFSNYYLPYLGIAPRISNITTTGTTTTQAGSQQTTLGSATGVGKPVVYDSDRLYATADELLFKPNRDPNVAALTGSELAKREFFLTANSRAPETTLFGTPRISLWPSQRLPAPAANVATPTPRDQLLAFCGKIGGNPYYFERYSIAVGPGSVPATASAASMTSDYASIPRNQVLFSYLGRLLDSLVPGFGSSFTTKWSVDGNTQVSTLAVDYLRSHANLYQSPSGTRAGANSWGYEVPVGGTNQGGYVMPLKINGKLGFGRSTTITEAAVVFIATATDATHATTRMQTVMFFNIFRPTPTSGVAGPAIRFRVTTPFGINGEIRSKIRPGGGTASGRNFSFIGPHTLLFKNGDATNPPRTAGSSDIDNDYPFFTEEIPVVGPTFNFAGGNATIEILEPDTAAPQVIQTLILNFPPITGLPLPQPVNMSGNFVTTNGTYATGGTFAENFASRLVVGMVNWNIMRPGDIAKSVRFSSATSGPNAAPHKGDFRLLSLKESVHAASNWFEPTPGYSLPVAAYAFDGNGTATTAAVTAARQNRFAQTLRNDFFMISRPSWGQNYQYGWSDGKNGFGGLNSQVASQFLGAGYDRTRPSPADWVTPGGLVAGIQMGSSTNCVPTPVIPQGLPAASNSAGGAGDFTSNYGWCSDGADIAIPDFGFLTQSDGGYFSEMDGLDDTGEVCEPNRQIPSPVVFGTLPSVDSAGNPAPWQSLLFCPNPAAGNAHPGFGTGVGGSGPAARAPFSILPDHLFLDLWWMPAVDPYAVSEPLSTAGKVNLNYRIAPFDYITRSTGLQAVMKSVKLAGVPDNQSSGYKQWGDKTTWGSSPAAPFNSMNFPTRFNLNMSETDGSLQDFVTRFDSGDVFRSASEICSIRLVPSGETTSTLPAWWNARRLTGDNLREQPYSAIYSRITTQSNTYTVHVRAQAVKKVPGTPADAFDPASDQVSGEWRGSFQIERYIDPNDPALTGVDFASATTLKSLGPLYRFRVLNSSQFAP